MNNAIYKLVDPRIWAEAMTAGVFKGVGVDVEDGYILACCSRPIGRVEVEA